MRKLTLKKPKLFKGLNHPYRMVFINEDSLEEVASFHMTKKSVYTLFSTLFIIIILITVSILLLTPMRYYIPGYGSGQDRTQVIQLKRSVDSLSLMVKAGNEQATAIQKIIRGEDDGALDTAMLKPELIEASGRESILPSSEEIKQQAQVEVKTNEVKKKRGRRR